MSFLVKSFLSEIVQDLKSQFACPSKSLTGAICTRQWTKKSKPLVYAAIDRLEVKPDHNVLEIGFGRGEGLARVFSIVEKGKGKIFGTEISNYMFQYVSEEFADELTVESYEDVFNPKKIALEKSYGLPFLSYPTNFFNGIYHVDVYYMWSDYMLKNMCSEFWRTLKPGSLLVAAMELKRLKKFEKFKVLSYDQFDPLRYLGTLEAMGFKNIQIIYQNVDDNGNVLESGVHEIQLLVAQKPDVEEPCSVEDEFARLEEMVKQDLVLESVLQSQRARPKTEMEKLKESIIEDSSQPSAKKSIIKEI